VRFDTLELIAYGPFTGRKLDLRGDFHLIHGPNEAGKSSALRAVVDVLYGIPANTTDAHLHDMQSLRVGARLRSATDQSLAFIRRKGNKNTLLDLANVALPEDALAPFLGGVTRAVFTTMFGLDHVRFREGAESLLQPQGTLGAVLFGASTGTRVLERVLSRLDEEANELFTPRGKQRRIPALLREHDLALQRAREASLAADEWRQRAEALAQQEQEREQRARERQALSLQRARLVRIQGTLPKARAWLRAVEALAPLADAVLVSPEAPEARRHAARAEAEAEAQRHAAEAQAQRLRVDRAACEPPAAVLAARSAIQALWDRRARVVAEDTRQAEAEAERTSLLRAVAARERALGGRPPRPDRSLRTRLHALVRERDVLDAAARAAEAEVRRLRAQALALADGAVAEGARSPSPDPELLRALARRAERHTASERRRPEVERELARVEAEVTRLRASLRPAPRPAQVVPAAESIDHHARQLEGHVRRQEAHDDRRATRLSSEREARRALDVLLASGTPPTEAELARARQARDEVLRAALARTSPVDEAVLWAAVSEADRLADRLRREADRSARRVSLEAELLASGRELASLDEEGQRLGRARAEAEAAWRAEWGELGPEVRTPAEMRAWAARYHEVGVLEVRAAELRATLEVTRHETEELRSQLRAAGAVVEVAARAGVEAWAQAAEDQARREDEARRAHERHREAHRRATAAEAEAEVEVQRAREALREWGERWRAALIEAGQATDVVPDDVLSLLDEADGLHRDLERLSEHEAQLARTQAERATFDADVRRALAPLVDVVDGLAPQADTLAALGRAHEALLRAQDDAQQVRELDKARELAETQARAAAERAEAARGQLEQLMARAGVTTRQALELAEERSEARRRAEATLQQAEAELEAAGGGLELSALLREVEGQRPEDVAVELAQVTAAHDQLEHALSALDQAIGGERMRQRGVQGAAEAARAAEDAQATVAELRRQVDRWALVRLSAAVLRRHADRYREAHAGPLLARASAHVRVLTRGALVRLEAGLDGDRPVLQGVREGGARVSLAGMSDGTRDQLYLALRLATLEAYLDERKVEPMPLVVDDILLHFDDDRAAAALTVLGEVSSRAQVLFFTHHSRLVELARTCVPRARLCEHAL
jgi:uncharacterized protein YhaN